MEFKSINPYNNEMVGHISALTDAALNEKWNIPTGV